MNPAVTSAEERLPGRRFPWLLTAWIGLLLLACFYPVLGRMVRDWYIDEDMGHGFFVPAVSAYMIWQRKNELLARNYSPALGGLAIVLLGGLLLVVGTYAVEQTLMRGSFLVALWGAVATLGGWRLLRDIAFPLLLLVFMIPLPAVIYNQITFPLQLFASQVAEAALGLLGIPVLREGNILELPSQRLSVAEACSGIRSLMSLMYLSLVYGYFFDSRWPVRVLLVLLTPAIAIFVNSLRVTATGLLSEYNPELAQGVFHSMEGWLMFLLALALLFALHRAISLAAVKYARPR
ncbi:MAG: exosortase/archaeosortase family protein [Bryobacteraceae bacterium]|nr:exosortase/archaeosortase family protein [Bryobacteraceae bacterium]MCX7602816.1 exosortase/archaeosortase family protein [Bryobacteraceae bacterium]